jgi:hypothetical protein
VSFWLLGYLIAQGATESGIVQAMALTAVAGSVLQAVAIWLLVRAVFPAKPGYVRPPWAVRLVGGFVGLLIGLALAMLLGDAIGAMLNISNFEGGRGYFVVMCLIPVFMIVGAVGGALAAPWVRPSSNSPTPLPPS